MEFTNQSDWSCAAAQRKILEFGNEHRNSILGVVSKLCFPKKVGKQIFGTKILDYANGKQILLTKKG
jgi:hypothetical protein